MKPINLEDGVVKITDATIPEELKAVFANLKDWISAQEASTQDAIASLSARVQQLEARCGSLEPLLSDCYLPGLG